MILRAMRTQATNKIPETKANNDTMSAPPLLGSSALGAGAGEGAGAGAWASALGAGAGAGAGAGGGGGGGGVQGALATTPPALDSITPSLQLASALAPAGPPAVAVLALASATTCGLSWARAIGATASST